MVIWLLNHHGTVSWPGGQGIENGYHLKLMNCAVGSMAASESTPYPNNKDVTEGNQSRGIYRLIQRLSESMISFLPYQLRIFPT